MIEALEIINYQPHENSILNFHKGVNVIKGTSHGGKTSIWRAIRWVLQNRPLGEGFKSWFANKDDYVVAGVEFDNGYVYRRKGPGENVYQISGIDDDLAAVRSDVPDEVKEITQMNDINVQGQDDKYFLLQESAGKVAKALNSVAGLEIIDETQISAKSLIKTTENELAYVKKERDRKAEQLLGYKYLDEVEPIVIRIKDTFIEFNDKRAYAADLQDLIVNITSTKAIRDEIKEWLKVKERYTKLKEGLTIANDLYKEYSDLEELVSNIYSLNKTRKEMKEWLKVKDSYNKIVNRMAFYKEKKEYFRQLNDTIDSIKQTVSVKNSLNKQVLKLRKQYDEKLKRAGVCPLCKRPW